MSSSTASILKPSDIKFYLSGGTNNIDPDFSVGGPISNTEIIDNILHNLFDRVITKEATEGDTEYRCFYIKNTHTIEQLKGTKIWIESGTSSSKTYISLGIGAAGINQQEILVPNENTDPAVVGFSIPLQPPAQPNIGDLGPGDFIGIWVRYTIQEGAEERGEDTAVIRIEGDRAPVNTLLPPIICPAETHYDPNTNACIPKTQIPVCPAGFHYDEAVQNCVLDQTPPITCPAGTHYDPNTQACIPENQIPTCPTGFHYDESVQNCVPDGTPPPSVSLFNIAAAGDFTCSSNGEDTMNTMNDFMDGSQDIALLLGDFSYVDGDQSCFIELTQQVFGSAFPNRLYPIIGNHDDTEDGAARDRDDIIDTYPAIPSQGYYSFTKGNIRFIMLDTQSNYRQGSSQYAFAENELRIADADPSILWIIVCYHKPSITPHTDHAPLTDFRDDYHSLFDQYHVDLILTGHNHNYSRSHPIRHNTSSPNTPTVIDSGLTNYTDVDGRIYLTVGSGGRARDSIDDDPAWLAAGNGSDYGALLISLTETIQGRANRLDCRFRTNNGDDDDVFILTKTVNPVPPGGGGGGGGGGGSGGGAGIDEFGIQWMSATGSQHVHPQSRFDTDDFRWSENYDNIENGYESTIYFLFDGVASGGHCASKMWGGNHSGGCQHTEGGDCCCFPAGYPAITSKGLIPIEQIKEGDYVYTHKGRYMKVLGGSEHFHTGYTYTIKTYGTSNYETTATHVHPFLTKDRGWVRAEDLTKDDWLLIPINKTVKDITSVSIPFIKKIGNQHSKLETIQTVELQLNTELLTIAGYYLAEGNLNKYESGEYGRISFTFSSKDSDIKHIDTLTESISKLGFKSHKFYRKEYNTCIVSFCSVPLATWLSKEFGHGSKNKKLPQWAIELPNDKTNILFESYMNGDGYHVSKGKHKSRHVKSISENLIIGMRDIALRLGYKTSLRKQNLPLESKILGRWVKINLPYELYVSKPNPDNFNKNNNDSKIKIDSDYQYNKIRSIDKKPFAGLVYNIGVEEDHSYTINSNIVSNCWYDIGIRANGDIQLQTERPHPSNHDFSVPSSMQFMDNIGKGMEGNRIGIKWLIYPIKIGGDVEDGGIRLKMWVDTSGFVNGKPQNVWRLAVDITDTGQILGDMPALSEQEIEIRNSDTDDTEDYAGGVHVRYLRRPQDIP